MIKREKRRYLALQIIGKHHFNEYTVLDAVQSSVCRLFGEYGASKTGIKLIKSIPEKNQLILRCSHLMLEKVRASIALTSEINGRSTSIHVVGVSGTLKALLKKI